MSIRQTSSAPCVATLDIGSSSVRALLFNSGARQIEGFGSHAPYQIETSPDGAAEIDPEMLAGLVFNCLDELHAQVSRAGLAPAAVGSSAFWHSFCGVDEGGNPTVPILHLLDTRSANQVESVPNAHQRTGCPPHTSYWSSKLLWLGQNRAPEFRATRAWLSFPEYLFQKLFGRPRASTSMVSGTGLWNLKTQDYDEQTLAALPISRDQLLAPDLLDRPEFHLLPDHARRWPAFDGIPWFPAIGDGAANHIGSGCVAPGQFSLMAGTTGAVRALIPTHDVDISEGLWCYCLDRDRLLMGGALSNGGNVYAWLRSVLKWPENLQARLLAAAPGSHGLTILPFLAGERSPYWRVDLRGAIQGLSLTTDSFRLIHAALEAIALSFRSIYRLIAERLGEPSEVIASGGALADDRAWVQMIADALGTAMALGEVREASSRGAAMFVLERLGLITDVRDMRLSKREVYLPRGEFAAIYERLANHQSALYDRMFGH